MLDKKPSNTSPHVGVHEVGIKLVLCHLLNPLQTNHLCVSKVQPIQTNGSNHL